MAITNEAIKYKEIQQKVFSEQVKILHLNLLVSVPANFICATIVFIGLYLRSTSPNDHITTWFVLVCVVSLFRLFGLFYYSRNQNNNYLHLYIFIFGMALSAALWGIVGSLLMPSDNLLQQMLIIVIIAGVTAGGVQTLNANLLASLTYVSVIVIPLTIWLFAQAGYTYYMLGITMLTYVIFMLTTSVRGYKLLLNSLTLRFENILLIQNLSDSNKKLFSSYKILEQHEHEISLINKMNELLQTCQTTNEAYDIIYLSAKQLFVDFGGGLVVLNTETNTLETIKQWGSNQAIASNLAISDCWALRKGTIYHVTDTTKALSCQHFNYTPTAYICIPLIIRREIVGLFVLHTLRKETLTSYKIELAASFGECIQLSLTSIKLREMLYDQAIRDPVTGLFNRRYLDEVFKRELQLMIRQNKKLCVAMIDLDKFKTLNDNFGHEAGDVFLKFVGTVLKENTRASDIACRYGGDEFLIVFVDSDIESTVQRLDHIKRTIKNEKLFCNEQILPSLTISIGVAEAPEQGNTVIDIINAADEALYSAKQSGRDRIEIASQIITRDVE